METDIIQFTLVILFYLGAQGRQQLGDLRVAKGGGAAGVGGLGPGKDLRGLRLRRCLFWSGVERF